MIIEYACGKIYIYIQMHVYGTNYQTLQTRAKVELVFPFELFYNFPGEFNPLIEIYK